MLRPKGASLGKIMENHAKQPWLGALGYNKTWLRWLHSINNKQLHYAGMNIHQDKSNIGMQWTIIFIIIQS